MISLCSFSLFPFHVLKQPRGRRKINTGGEAAAIFFLRNWNNANKAEALRGGSWNNNPRNVRVPNRNSTALYRVRKPPSIAITCPIVKLAPGLQSHTTAEAISSGRPNRPMGACEIIRFTMSGS